MKRTQQSQRKEKSERGFSLVEVSVAMAIAAVALVTLLGLIPQALKTMRDAADQAIGGRIHQQILSELQMTPFRDQFGSPNLATSPLKPYHKQVRVFDQQGVELGYQIANRSFDTGRSSMNPDEIDFAWSYTARIWLPAFDRNRAPPSREGGVVVGDVSDPAGNSLAPPELMTVIVEVVPFKIPGDSFTDSLSNVELYFDDPDNAWSIETYQSTVVRLGNDFQSN